MFNVHFVVVDDDEWELTIYPQELLNVVTNIRIHSSQLIPSCILILECTQAN
jgi:hypothetical protein